MSGPASPSMFANLEKMAKDPNRILEQRLADTCKWFYENMQYIPKDNLTKRIQFLEKFVEIQIELNASLVQRMQMSEHRQKSERLWVPRGMSVSGDLKEYG